MVNKLTVFECNDCNSQFGIIAHSDFEEEDVTFCVLCGGMIENESALDEFLTADDYED